LNGLGPHASCVYPLRGYAARFSTAFEESNIYTHTQRPTAGMCVDGRRDLLCYFSNEI
jgi:hypothetical protein